MVHINDRKMDIIEQINLLVKKAKEKDCKPQKRQDLINLYGEGLKNKLMQADFAILKLEEISNRSDQIQTATSEEPKVDDQIYFYSDAFWAFLYASLDVLAQLVNQSLKLNLPEDKTDFKKVKNKLQGNAYKDSDVSKLFNNCRRGFQFIRLDKYRNCALHRRHVFFNESLQIDRGSQGYANISITGNMTRVERILCDDPYEIIPTVNQGRNIPDWMRKMQTDIQQYIFQILEVTKPSK